MIPTGEVSPSIHRWENEGGRYSVTDEPDPQRERHPLDSFDVASSDLNAAGETEIRHETQEIAVSGGLHRRQRSATTANWWRKLD